MLLLKTQITGERLAHNRVAAFVFPMWEIGLFIECYGCADELCFFFFFGYLLSCLLSFSFFLTAITIFKKASLKGILSPISAAVHHACIGQV